MLLKRTPIEVEKKLNSTVCNLFFPGFQIFPSIENFVWSEIVSVTVDFFFEMNKKDAMQKN